MDSSTRNHVLHCDISHYLIRKQNVKLEDFITAIRESYIGKVNYLRNLEIIISVQLRKEIQEPPPVASPTKY